MNFVYALTPPPALNSAFGNAGRNRPSRKIWAASLPPRNL